MASIKWGTTVAVATALTTDLNSLANGSTSAVSAAYDNATNKHLFIDLEVYLASLTPTGAPSVSVHLLPSVDGTNYADSGSDTVIAVFPLTTSASAKRKTATNIPIPPFSFKLALTNNSGVSLASSANTLKYSLHSQDIV